MKALGSETASELKLPNVNLGADADRRELGTCAEGAAPAGLAGAAVKACGWVVSALEAGTCWAASVCSCDLATVVVLEGAAEVCESAFCFWGWAKGCRAAGSLALGVAGVGVEGAGTCSWGVSGLAGIAATYRCTKTVSVMWMWSLMCSHHRFEALQACHSICTLGPSTPFVQCFVVFHASTLWLLLGLRV